ncbi:erythrocyte binding protein 37.2 precursor [Babesia divergens]|uniref:Erythrocyte binding protein 37.2 n=1 Tax=Babesia divergens TaxID=32595 RepID=A0AAD9LFF6_BABDI|nr:erythrocyte binding protein 37.2 precursor [Babesia divergens]
MKFLGILRASALFILASAFHGQPVSCGLFNKILSSKKSSNANQSENSEGDLAAQMKMLTEKLQALEAGLDKAPKESSTINLPDGSNNPNGSMATPSSNGAAELEKVMQAEHEELLKRIAEQRTELVERLSKSDAPFSLEDMTLFLGILRDEADVDPEAVQKVGEEIHAYLGSLGIHGEDAKGSLEKLMEKIMEQREYLLDLFYGPSQQHSDEASEASEVDAKSYVNSQQEDSTVKSQAV